MNGIAVYASEGQRLMDNLSKTDIASGWGSMIQSSEINWLIIGGIGIIIIALISFVIVPKFLDKTLGLIAFTGLVALAGVSAMIIPQLSNQPTIFQAFEESKPEQIQIYNIQPTEFIISWRTQFPVTGAVVYGPDKKSLENVAVEIEPTQKRINHLIRVIDLEPGKTYFIKIISGGKEYLIDGEPLMVTLPRR